VLLSGATPIVTRGNAINIHNLQGFVAIIDGKVAGAALCKIRGDDCEIVALYSNIKSRGIGNDLINSVIGMAKYEGCRRVWLITMNDNNHAIRFYQRRGLDLKAAYINAFDVTRKLKEMPLHGDVLALTVFP